MTYRANERSRLSRDFVAAGDGLGAFGAALILPVQTHLEAGRVAAGQWIYAKPRHARADQEADKQTRQIQDLMPSGPRSRARKLGAFPINASKGPATAAAGEQPCRHPHTGPERRAAAAGRCTPRRSRGTLRDGRRRTERCAQQNRPETCGVCSAPGHVQGLHQQHASVGSMDPHQARLGGPFHAGTLRAHLLSGGQHPHPTAVIHHRQ